jgi:hypothetical protein
LSGEQWALASIEFLFPSRGVIMVMMGLVNFRSLAFSSLYFLLLPGLAPGALHIEGPGYNSGTNQKA